MKLLLHTHTVMSFILAITALGMFMHLVRLRQPVNAKKWLVGFYLGILLWQTENMVRYSVPLEYIGTVAYKLQTIFGLIPLLSVTLISHEQYVYRFLVTTYKREQKVVFWISVGVCLCELLFVTWNEWYNNSNMELMMLSAFLLGSIFTIWIIILALRKAVYLRSINRRASKAHFIYAAINACYVGGSIFSLFFSFFSAPGFWSYFLLVWLGNLASIVLYIVTAAVPASFQIKVTGFTFVLAATLLTIITLTFYPPAMLDDIPVRLAQQEGLEKMMIITAFVALMIVTLMPFMLRISITT
ncbi:MAG: hypothetical protein ICV53_21080, partial [Flavisolibacter sp.]|nr:hypothetical protein [Flavisolibacter sp.]